MDENIESFAKEMDKVYSFHKPKKGESWKDCTIKFLQDKLVEEHLEWLKASSGELTGLNDKDLSAKELVDIANVCMMLYHRLKQPKCAHCDGKGSTTLDCCYRGTGRLLPPGHSGMYGPVKCCACGGKGIL
jgi:hypothetical protein